jgi:hypothetical protein
MDVHCKSSFPVLALPAATREPLLLRLPAVKVLIVKPFGVGYRTEAALLYLWPR